MPLTELSLSLRLDVSPSVVFVLDASESCRAQQGQIVSLVQQVLTRLPVELESLIYFLGNSQRYPSADFETYASRWFEENQARGSVIGPVINSLVPTDYDSIVIVGSGTIYDLEDWLDEETSVKVLLVPLAEPVYRTDAGLTTCDADPGQVAAALHDPPTEARVFGRGFMPLWWSNAGYGLQLEDGTAALAAHDITDYAIQLRCFVGDGTDLQCAATHASGKNVEHRFEEVSLAESNTPSGAYLDAKEVQAFRRASEKEDILCPVCGSTHSWRALQCVQDGGYSILGTSIYRTLTDNKIAGLVVFTPRADGSVYCHRYDSPVLRIAAGSIVLQHGAELSLWQWADDSRSWRCVETSLEPYHRLADGSYVVVLR
jgi:hypothetical protein